MQSQVSIGRFDANIRNFIGTQSESEACNRYLEDAMPSIVGQHQGIIGNYLERMLQPIADHFMEGLDLAGLLEIIAQPPQPSTCNPQ